MKKIYFLTFLTLLFGGAIAQKQITRFSNPTTDSPNRITFIDTLKGRALFSAFTPEDGTILYSTDGKITKKVAAGNEGAAIDNYYVNQRLKSGRFLYFTVDNSLFRTDGDSVLSVFSEPTTRLFALSVINNLVYFIVTEGKGEVLITSNNSGERIYTSKLIQLAENGTTTVVDSFMYHPELADGTYHYARKLPNKDVELVTFNGIEKPKQLGVVENTSENPPRYLQRRMAYGQSSYLLTYGSSNRYFVPDLSGNYRSLDWGDYFYGDFVSNSTGDSAVYVSRKTAQLLEIFKQERNGTLILKNSGSLDDIFPPTEFNKQAQRRSFSYDGNRLFYYTRQGAEAISGLRINEYDFETKKYRTSVNLLTYFIETKNYQYFFDYKGPTRIDNATYRVETAAMFADYNIQTQQYVNFIPKEPFVYPERNLIYQLNEGKILVTDKIYKLTDKGQEPLFEERQIFSYENASLKTHQFGDKLLLIKTPPFGKDGTEVWVSTDSNGLAVKLAAFSGRVTSITNNLLSRDSPRAFLLSIQGQYTPNQKIEIYETDGTAAGTKLLYSSGNADIKSITGGFNAANGVIYILNTEGKDKYLYVTTTSQKFINLPDPTKSNSLVSTTSNSYLLGETGKPNGTQNLFIIQPDGVKFLADNISYATPVNDKLICSAPTVPGGNQIVSDQNIFYFDGEKRTDLFTALKFNSTRSYSRYVSIKKGLSVFVLDVVSGKLTETALKLTGEGAEVDLFEIDGGFAVTAGSGLEAFYNGKQFSYNGNSSVTNVLSVKGGVMIQQGRKGDHPTGLVYYNFDRKRASIVLEDTRFNQINVGKGSDFILIDLFTQYNNKDIRYYGLTTNKLTPIPGNNAFFGYRIFQNKLLEATSKNNYVVWAYDGQQLSRTYQLPERSTIKQIGENVYASVFLPTTGYEMAQLDKDSISYYNEIIKGNQGISVNIYDADNLFERSGQVFVYGFTYEHGQQVWRLGEFQNNKQDIIKPLTPVVKPLDPEIKPTAPEVKPLANEEVLEITIYPNPSSQFINIDTEQFYDYQLINMSGIVMQKGKLKQRTLLDIKSLPSGTYLLNLSSGNKTVSRRIIKID